MQLAAAAATLREAAAPPLPGARTESYLTPARRFGDAAVARLWARGRNLSIDAAVALALDRLGPGQPAPRGESPALAAAQPRLVPVAPPSSLTRREHQIAALVAGGRSNKAIAAELSISPTTTARHIANIMAELGFNSRAQTPPGSSASSAAPTWRPGSPTGVSPRTCDPGPPRPGYVSSPSPARAGPGWQASETCGV